MTAGRVARAMVARAMVVGVVLASAATVSTAESATPRPNAASAPRHDAAGSLVALSPARVLDTRSGLGASRAPVRSGHAIAVQVAGRGGVPADGVSAVAVTLTETGAGRRAM